MELKAVNISELLSNMFGEETMQDQAAEPKMVPLTHLEAYMTMLADQTALIVRQRNEVCDALDEAEKDHAKCHASTEKQFESIKNHIRIQGFAEALAFGKYPENIMEDLQPETIQDFMDIAEKTITILDEKRKLKIN